MIATPGSGRGLVAGRGLSNFTGPASIVTSCGMRVKVSRELTLDPLLFFQPGLAFVSRTE